MSNVLLIGSGAREHAMAWSLVRSSRLKKLFIAPGNPGTAACGENVRLTGEDPAGIVAFCEARRIDLVLVGPETPLAAGLADALRGAGIRCFGPSQAAARIESSKVFAKEFMQRHGIPTARHRAFTDYQHALDHLRAVEYPVVLKASGLAAGKGVVLPDSPKQAEAELRRILIDRQFGEAGDAIVIEERMSGPEITLLAFSDGVTVKPMLPSQDHKRALDGDEGLNTGGMGAYTPVPACPPELVEELLQTAMQPCIDGLRDEGSPFVGVLYGGFMLTRSGPRVVEFNCRFGDPEAEVVLPLLETDLLQVADACVDGRLAETQISWKRGAAACVVLASGGYPEKYETGFPIEGLDLDVPNAIVFHAGTALDGNRIVTAGGRVLCVTGIGSSIEAALAAAYARVHDVRFEGMHYRTDIGYRVVSSAGTKSDEATDEERMRGFQGGKTW